MCSQWGHETSHLITLKVGVLSYKGNSDNNNENIVQFYSQWKYPSVIWFAGNEKYYPQNMLFKNS